MNLNDMNEIHLRLKAAQFHLAKLSTISGFYRAGKFVVVDEELTLTASHKTTLKNKFDAIAASMKKALDSLPGPTGKVGIVNTEAVAAIWQAPDRIFNNLSDLVGQAAQLLERVAPPSLQPDGSYTPPDYPDAIAQETADTLATLKAAGKWWIDQEAAKLE